MYSKRFIRESDINRIVKKVILKESKEEQEEAEFKEPIFKGIEKIKFRKNSDSGKYELLFTLSIENPSKLNIKIKNYDIDVYLNGEKVGNCKMEDETIQLKKKEITKIVVPMEIQLGSKIVKDLIISFLKNPKSTHKLNLKGKLKGGIFIFNKTIDIDINQNIGKANIENVKNFISIVDLGPLNYLKDNINKILNIFD